MVLVEHTGSQISDATFGLIAKARELASALGVESEVVVFGSRDLATRLGSVDTVLSVEHPSLSEYLPEAYERTLLEVLRKRAPRLLLLSSATIGLDLGAALSVRWNAPLVSSVSSLALEGDVLVATSQVLGGKLAVECVLAGERSIVTVLGGAFTSEAGAGSEASAVVDIMPPPELETPRMDLRRVSEADSGDVDITAVDMLVAVGRGIETRDNLEVVLELAETLGVPLCASRPIIDAGWLSKSRQVGQSGLKVKPRAYLAFGISGAPEHLEGMRRAELIVACNSDPRAPIFDVAHYGTTSDLFDLVPELVEKLRG